MHQLFAGNGGKDPQLEQTLEILNEKISVCQQKLNSLRQDKKIAKGDEGQTPKESVKLGKGNAHKKL